MIVRGDPNSRCNVSLEQHQLWKNTMSDSDADVTGRPAKRQRFAFKTLKERVSQVRAPAPRRTADSFDACMPAPTRQALHRRRMVHRTAAEQLSGATKCSSRIACRTPPPSVTTVFSRPADRLCKRASGPERAYSSPKPHALRNGKNERAYSSTSPLSALRSTLVPVCRCTMGNKQTLCPCPRNCHQDVCKT